MATRRLLAAARRDSAWRLALATVAVTCAVLFLILRLWQADLRVPFEYRGGESMWNIAVIKGIVDHGWFLTNPDLSAPGTQQLYDFPFFSSDNLHLLLIKLLSFVTSDPALLINAYYLAGFPLVALSAALCLRALGVSSGPALVSAVLFALLPYHLLRGQEQLFLGAYWSIPLIAYLVVAVYAEWPLFKPRRDASGPGAIALRFLSRRTLVTVALCVLIGSSDVYYATFAVILVLIASGLTALVSGRTRPLVIGGTLAVLVSAVLALNLLPTFAYQLRHGRNDVATQREPIESETLALRPAALVLPVDDHRVNPLADLKERFRDARSPRGSGPHEADHATLGVVGTAGLLLLVGVALASLVARPRGRVPSPLQRYASAGAVTALSIGLIGGIPTLVALLASPRLPAWNRISPLVAFFSLMALGSALGALRYLAKTQGQRAGYWVVLGAILAIGVVDQTTPVMVPRYADNARSYETDRRFFASIQSRLPAGAMVFQLPYVPFPHTGQLQRAAGYDGLRGYLHTNRLRWSFGAMKGRAPAEWQRRVSGQPPAQMLSSLKRAGFGALLFDRRAGPGRDGHLEGELTRLAGAPLVSRNGRFAFFDLRRHGPGGR